jgi:hypothetical protein
MAFDPDTAYYNDWRYMDRVKDVAWEKPDGTTVTGLKARWARQSKSDIQSAGGGGGHTTEAAAIVVWQPKPADVDEDDWQPSFTPATGHVLREVETGRGWLVLSAEAVGLCKWELVCDREITNA